MKTNNLKNIDKGDLKTLTSCVNFLTEEGYEAQFKVVKGGLKSLATDKIYQSGDVSIISFYRFEGESDPADNAILYVIETDSGERGTLIDAYGAYSDPHVDAFIKEVENIKKEHMKVKV
ncbi:MAG: hypothetical protein WAQ28_02515 [Bacteroidia bacterium]